MRQVNLVDFGDLLHDAQTLGFNWNTIHDVLLKDIFGSYPGGNRDVYCPVKYPEESERWSEDTKKVVAHFCESHRVSWFTIQMD